MPEKSFSSRSPETRPVSRMAEAPIVKPTLKPETISPSGVYLNPTGVVNAGSSAPFTAGIAPGELLTFYLRYTNPGKLPINDVGVVDNLTPRFEYVPGTSKTDRGFS